MEIIPIRIILKEKEPQFIHLQDVIEAKQKMLLEKQKKIRLISKQNQYLDGVRSDYATYYSYICQQKQDQIKALKMLNDYMEDLAITEKISKHNIEDAKVEQAKIMREINSIQKGLNSIMENTDKNMESINKIIKPINKNIEPINKNIKPINKNILNIQN
jgi:hypothetical protein